MSLPAQDDALWTAVLLAPTDKKMENAMLRSEGTIAIEREKTTGAIQVYEERLRNMKEELKRMDAFLQSIMKSPSSLSIIFTDLDGNILSWNAGAENMFGYKAEEVVGSRKIDILYCKDAESTEKLKEVRATIYDRKKDTSCEVIEMAKDGRELWVKLTLTPRIDENGEVAGILGIGEDITVQKETDRVKSEIISILSHELRSPLTSILNSLSLVAGGDTGELPAQAGRMVDIAYRNGERILRMTNVMLDIEKIESGKMEFHTQPVDLMTLVEQTIEVNQGYAAQFDVEFAIEDALPSVKVNVDSDRLIQVLTNLLSNAAKFSPPNEQVDVSALRHNGAVRVAVTDHGPGIPKDYRDRIFQRFVQAHSSGDQRKKGTGLGLSISKALIEGMGGQIGFETEANVGTTFYFDLPEYCELPVP